MLVCICKGLSERAVLRTIQAGASTVDEIGRACGAGTDCGTCQGALEAMLSSTHALARDVGARADQLVSPSRLVECGRGARRAA